jgi:hypothetical protein
MPEILAVDVRSRILALLDEAVLGPPERQSYFTDPGRAGGMIGTIEEIDAGDASRDIGGASIAAHVRHTVFALEVAESFMRGETKSWDWKASWSVHVVDGPAWNELRESLARGHGRMRHAIEEWALTTPEAVSEAIGQVAHVAYHLGAIRQKVATLRGAGSGEPGPPPARNALCSAQLLQPGLQRDDEALQRLCAALGVLAGPGTGRAARCTGGRHPRATRRAARRSARARPHAAIGTRGTRFALLH